MILDLDREFASNFKAIMNFSGHEAELVNFDELKEIDSNPDVVLLDIMMGIRGNLLAKLKNRRLVLLSSVKLSDSEIEYLKSKYGISDYIEKPVSFPDFLERMKNF
jgi:DNA-binding response OmpR family regulator